MREYFVDLYDEYGESERCSFKIEYECDENMVARFANELLELGGIRKHYLN